ncbi:hypothetical protein [Luteococcus peritonei]|uniref:Uncharacterized protein n=1 Tax=Luteococcus peritonei TaxID=88874 RepID=A0ABW4RYL3_9ACTN
MNLFTPPEPRPAPERLRARILAEVEQDVLDGRDEDDQRGRPRRWLAPVVAAGLLAALAGGAAVMNGVGLPGPANALSATPEEGLVGDALAWSCRVRHEEQLGLAAQGVVLSPSGRTALAFSSGEQFLLCSASEQAVGTGRMDADGVATLDTTIGDHHLLAAGGQAVGGADRGRLGEDGVRVQDGWWVADRVVPTEALAAEPDALEVVLDGPDGVSAAQMLIPWPGIQRSWGLTGGPLEEACRQAHLPEEGSLSASLASPEGHGLLQVLADGSLQACTADGEAAVTTDPVPAGAVSQPVVLRASGRATTTVVAGRLPQGVTGVQLRTPRGARQATVRDGLWVAEDQASPAQRGLDPQKVWVQMTGSRPQGFWLDWHTAPGDRTSVSSRLPAQWTGQQLARACSTSADRRVVAVSGPGHVVWVETAGAPLVCHAGAGFSYTVEADTSRQRTAKAFHVGKSWRENGAGMFYAAGLLPEGVSHVVFNTPDGPLPATVEHGRWIYEQQMVPFRVSAGPVSVTLTGADGSQTIQLR